MNRHERRARRKKNARKGTAEWDAYDSAVDKIIDNAFKIPLPPTLYHYTNKNGLEGILSRRVIHATHYRDVKDDPLEFRHMDQVVLQVARDFLKDATPTWIKVLNEFLAKYEGIKISEIPGPQMHIACFCREGDQTHLWRKFAGNGTGYCLGIKILNEAHDVKVADAFHLPIEYSPEKQEARLRDCFRSVIESRSKVPLLSEADVRSIALNGMYRIAALTNIGSKPLSYADEKESRFVVSLPDGMSPSERRALSVEDQPRRILWPFRSERRLPVLDVIYVGFQHDADEIHRVIGFLQGLGYGERTNPALPPVILSSAGGGGE